MIVRLIFLAVLISVLWAAPAHAYLDPVTSSMIITSFLGAVAGVIVAGKVFWRRILEAVGLIKEDPSTEDDTENS